ncbi:MAG: nudJ [Chthonomonadaceae bacterium]|nr:nudJ [Chthonomonadaceae bacterium]
MTRKVHVSTVIQESGRILLVQEAKQENRGLWNLPGGHLEESETLHHGALREVFEETGLQVALAGLVGIYTTLRAGYQAFRFVFAAPHPGGAAFAGDDILAVRWATPEEAAALSDAELVSPAMFRHILSDLQRNPLTSLSLLVEPQ